MGFPFRSSIIAFALLCASALPSHAVTQVLTNVGPGPIVTDTGTFSHVDIAPGALGGPLDTFFFQLSGPTSFSATVSLDSATGGITGFSLEVFNALNLLTPVLQTNAVVLGAGGSQGLFVNGFLGTAGDYLIKVLGTATHTPTTLYNGTLVVSQVPIPGAILLFGSGLVGLCALGRKRRRAKQMTAVS